MGQVELIVHMTFYISIGVEGVVAWFAQMGFTEDIMHDISSLDFGKKDQDMGKLGCC